MDYIGASIAGPSEAHTESSISIGSFDTEAEAEACTKYLKTKFVRAMQWIKKRTQNMRKTTWEFVPTQDFSPSSDIDWSQPIPDVDRQLYAKYGLNEEEIAFIENNVKEME
ncbi:MAG: hypothetical protein J6P18_00260 [Aeriscardovia sp.]|nr:hypothetical protein [Aeriscardovia sp.]